MLAVNRQRQVNHFTDSGALCSLELAAGVRDLVLKSPAVSSHRNEWEHTVNVHLFNTN